MSGMKPGMTAERAPAVWRAFCFGISEVRGATVVPVAFAVDLQVLRIMRLDARGNGSTLEIMTVKSESIEVDSDTAAALKTRAAERGVSVSALVAELVPLAIDDVALAELDRRWAAIENGQATVPHAEIERWLRSWGSGNFRPWSDR